MAIIARAQIPTVPEKPEPPQAEPAWLFDSIEAGAAAQPDPNSGLLKLDVVVTDLQGKSVAGLDENDLTLLDNGQPRKVITFQAFQGPASTPDARTEIILVIDEIDTPPVLLGRVEQVAQKFLLKNGGRLAQPVMVYRITSKGLLALSGPSYDGNLLAQQITERQEPRTIWRAADIHRQSFFNDARWVELPRAVVALGSIAIEERRAQGRKLLFWIGSPWAIKTGQWQNLFDTVTELSTRLREARISPWFGNFWRQPDQDVFPYQEFLEGVTAQKSASIENVALQVLAVQSGGGELSGEGDPADLIRQRVAQANAFDTITFDPPRTETIDEYHELKVVIGKPGLIATTRNGYYNEPSYYDQAPSGIERVNVAQLREAINELQQASDSEGERRLNEMELTERLSSAELAKLLTTLNGRKSKEALTALADQSAFLFPPAEDTLDKAPPSLQEQNQLIQRTVGYVSRMIPILPNLLTERITTLYSEPRQREQWKTNSGNQPLGFVSTSAATVHVSNGREVVQQVPTSANQRTSDVKGISLLTEGTFGPILASVLVAVAKPDSKLMWARWEKAEKGTLAVFRYNIPGETPVFQVGFCCMAIDGVQQSFETHAPTYGEIAVDPATGAILRLTMRASLAWRHPLQHSDIMIEYGPVTLGGTGYICPIRSVEISRQRSVVLRTEFGETFKVYAPFVTILNDVKYENYQLFRSSSRVLPGFTEVPNTK
jgi:VWFA-related protein